MKRRKGKSLLEELLDLGKPTRKSSSRRGTAFPKATRGSTHSSGKKSLGGTQMKSRNTWRNIT